MDFEPDRPRWRQVADVLRRRIADGTYTPGSRVPSVLALSAEFGIATSTSQKVHRSLRAEGLTHTQPGAGTFVSQRPPEDLTPTPADA
ncbi:GntR family transcriptional regulator [Streptomyces sp. Ru73]|uniref:GntR family transcriptional regulator n=1 Tax=Streptomyces sp. Ru73 TaxID=2080748 RepID=UPI000CDE4307|nr:winged helix-turn-helix domain-containing protein [Streptomyces sp. Ru73]POX37823.1 GntR family transcriptional regulator [Streptomyces sp. Ru73]